MREMIAKAVSGLVVAVLTGLAFWFASVHNPEAASAAPAAAPPETVEAAPPAQNPDVARGRAVYEELNCSTCHAIAGEGNPRYPLDGVGGRWEPEEIRSWITGTDFVADLLSGPILRRKQQYQSTPAPDLDALVLYLSGLR